MPFNFFQNSIENGVNQLPNEQYRDLQQAFINEQWDNTATKFQIEEQDEIGTFTFHCVEVWIDYVVGMTSTGYKNGDDFRKLLFKDLDHECIRGRYYKFNDNYWIGDFTDEYDSITKSMSVRRCNNFLKVVDPENGNIFSIPCVVDYDMSSPSVQVSSSIITPNNHAIVMVQGNEDTNRLFNLNTRVILGGRPFKLNAFQNTLLPNLSNEYPLILYLDFYLDELQAKDDLINQIAFNGDYNYTISIDANDLEITNGSEGQLTATVLLNGQEVNRNIIWETSNRLSVRIDSNGKYRIVGSPDTESTITAYIEGNNNIFDSILIKVVNTNDFTPKIIVEPLFSIIKQCDSIEFSIQIAYGSEIITDLTNVEVSLSDTEDLLENNFISIIKEQSNFILTAKKITNVPQSIFIKVNNDSPNFYIEDILEIRVVSMFG